MADHAQEPPAERSAAEIVNAERFRPVPDDPPSEPSHRDDRPARPIPRRVPRHRRVTTEPPEGSDPSPSPEPPRHASTENDEQLKRDKPPHWS